MQSSIFSNRGSILSSQALHRSEHEQKQAISHQIEQTGAWHWHRGNLWRHNTRQFSGSIQFYLFFYCF